MSNKSCVCFWLVWKSKRSTQSTYSGATRFLCEKLLVAGLPPTHRCTSVVPSRPRLPPTTQHAWARTPYLHKNHSLRRKPCSRRTKWCWTTCELWAVVTRVHAPLIPHWPLHTFQFRTRWRKYSAPFSTGFVITFPSKSNFRCFCRYSCVKFWCQYLRDLDNLSIYTLHNRPGFFRDGCLCFTLLCFVQNIRELYRKFSSKLILISSVWF